MASTPSASALSAVLRCQGNILARKQANKKRSPASVYGLGRTGGDSVRSYFRSLWGFVFHRERVDIPGVLSVTARFETSCSGKSFESKDQLLKNSTKFDSRMVMKAPGAKTKVMSDYGFAFKSQRYSVSSKTNPVLRLDGTRLRKLTLDHPRTLCVCVVCAQSISTLNRSSVNELFPLGLLWSLKDKLIYLTTAVSDSVRTQPGICRMNQLQPDCDKLSGCVKCTSEHHEDQGAEPGE
ncbi:uncharacterized protein LOC130104346 [Rhinichthys klamathensis goyatoka]|uniref:uncharacterized protein LOC130104346 n=1 Tax=Rhinichthys klamathensis goyatoka TaxID=3034132 RepID=UPI0024B48D7A|nr:uncharacterized protein LOC130104346 [Rhinichthys klamathensis goyatoka]